MLSVISLLEMNALCDFETNLGRIFLSRFAMVLDTSLYRTLQKLMGLKSVGFSRFFVFGISEMKVWLRFSSSMAPKLRIVKEAAMASWATISQQDLKKIGGRPSSLGVVSGFIWFKACSTSYAVKSWIKSSFIEGVIFGSIPWRILSKFEGVVKVKIFLK